MWMHKFRFVSLFVYVYSKLGYSTGQMRGNPFIPFTNPGTNMLDNMQHHTVMLLSLNQLY